jgi:DNA-binding response OmpR family regulator
VPKKILVVDDERNLVEMVKRRLEANHYDVVTAGDGEEGLAKVASEQPDLIVLDISMPKKDGYTFVKELRRNGHMKPIPVVILTARDGMADLFAMEGVSDYLVKPFKAEDLLGKIRAHLQE